MNRRRVLATVGSFPLLAPGCFGVQRFGSGPEEAYDSERLVEFGWQEESPLVGGLGPHSEMQYSVAVIDSPMDDDVNRTFLRENDGEDLLTFLDETAFETNRILALQARHSGGWRYLDADSLRLDVGKRIDGSISIGTAEGGNAAENRETLFVRVGVAEHDPTEARITIRGEDEAITVETE